MLTSIDVLIGLTVVVLALSMAVTVLTQAVTTLLNSRGRHLRRGLTDLLDQLDPALTAGLSKAVATQILTHPLVSGSTLPIPSQGQTGWFADALSRARRIAGGPRLGNVVHRDEFIRLLMDLAAEPGTHRLDAEARAALITALTNNGLPNPDATLKSIRTLALQLEGSSPELSNMARQNIAILQLQASTFCHCPTPFTTKPRRSSARSVWPGAPGMTTDPQRPASAGPRIADSVDDQDRIRPTDDRGRCQKIFEGSRGAS